MRGLVQKARLRKHSPDRRITEMSALPIAVPDDREAPAGLSSVVVPAVSAENLVRRYGEGSMAVALVHRRLAEIGDD